MTRVTPRSTTLAGKFRVAVEEMSVVPCEICQVDLVVLRAQAFPKIGGTLGIAVCRAPKTDEQAMDWIADMIQILAGDIELLRGQQLLIKKRAQARHSHPWLNELTSADTLYDIDHRVPLCEGGLDGLANLRVLCKGCHKQVTRELQARLARRPIKRGKRI